MKRFVLILSMGLMILAFCSSGLMGQNGNGNDNSTTNGYAIGKALPFGSIPMSLAVKILKSATDVDFYPHLGLHLGQVIQTYKSGELVMVYAGKDAVEVRLRGCITIVIVSEGF